MKYSPEELVKAISQLQQTKRKLEEEKSALIKEREGALQEAYIKVLALDDEQAQIHFGSSGNGVSFNDRFNSSVKSMKKEIKKNEHLIQLRGEVTEDIDDIVSTLEMLEQEKEQILLKIQEPALQSEEYRVLRQRMSEEPELATRRTVSTIATTTSPVARTLFSELAGDEEANEEDIDRVRQQEAAVWAQVDTFNRQFDEIVREKEKEIAACVASINMQRRSATASHFDAFDKEVASILAQTSTAHAPKRRQQLSKDDGILKVFLRQAQAEHKNFTAQYDLETHNLADKIRKNNAQWIKGLYAAHAQRDGSGIHDGQATGGKATAAAVEIRATTPTEDEEPWKIELQRKLTELHNCKLQQEMDNAAADRETVEKIKAMRVTRAPPPASIDESYMDSVVDNLIGLYLDINEAYFE